MSFLYSSDANSLDRWFASILAHSIVYVSLPVYFFVVVCAIGSYLKNHCPDQHQEASILSSSSNFKVTGLTFKFFIHFVLIFVTGVG